MDYHTSFIFTKPKYHKWSGLPWRSGSPTTNTSVWPVRFFQGKSNEFSHEDSFHYFIKNSQIELLSDSSAFGFVYKCTFQKSPQKSPYFYLNDKNESQDVTVIVLKCLLLNDRTKYDTDDDHFWQYKRMGGSPTTSRGKIPADFWKRSKRHFDMKDRFIEEVRMQTEISKLGIAALNRNAPVVLFSKIYGSTDHFKITSLIKNRMVNEPRNRPFEQLCDELYFKCKIPLEPDMNYYFGLIAMEYIEQKYTLFYNIIKPIIADYITLQPGQGSCFTEGAQHLTQNEVCCEKIHKYNSMALSEKSDRLRWAYNTGRYEIIRMAVDTGYTEGDYHTDNLMMDENSRKSILIDYGKAKKIKNFKEITAMWSRSLYGVSKQKKCNFRNILREVFYVTFDDDERGEEFKWFKNIDDNDIEILEYLHQHRTTLVEGRSATSLVEMINDQTTFQGFIGL